jgi:hypothetical protein
MEAMLDEQRTPVAPLVVVRVAIRCDDEKTFIERYHRFVKDDRLFIVTKTPQPIGALLRFVLTLRDEQPVIQGTGKVIRVRSDSGDPARPPGLLLRFATLDETSQRIIEAMHAARSERQARLHVVREPAAPAPEDVSSPDSGPNRGLLLASADVQPEPMHDETTGTFFLANHAPHFGERWNQELPANPLSEIPEDVLDYFVEWSVEHTASGIHQGEAPPRVEVTPPPELASPSASSPSLATLPLAASAARWPAWTVLVAGILVGVPLGAALLWAWHAPLPFAFGPLLAPVGQSRASAAAAPATLAPATVAPATVALPSDAPRSGVAAAPAVQPVAPAPGPAAPGTVPLTIRAQPAEVADAHVILDGKPIGRAPVTVQVAPGEHQVALNKSHYHNLMEKVSAPGELELTMIHR